MLKLLKWVYELGAENENRRVRGIINGIDAYSQAQIGVYRYEFDAPDTRESRRKALDREINDLNVKMQIIEAITIFIWWVGAVFAFRFLVGEFS